MYGLLTTMLYVHKGWTALYFDVAEYGVAWYVCSWAVFLLWVELFGESPVIRYPLSVVRRIDSFIAVSAMNFWVISFKTK